MERAFKLRLFLQYICRVELEHLPLALRKLTNTSLQYLSRPQAPTKAHLIKIPKSGLKSAYPDKGRVIPKIYFSGGRGGSGAAILMFPLGVTTATTWNQKRNSSASNTAMASQTNKNKVMHDFVLDLPRKFYFHCATKRRVSKHLPLYCRGLRSVSNRRSDIPLRRFQIMPPNREIGA